MTEESKVMTQAEAEQLKKELWYDEYMATDDDPDEDFDRCDFTGEECFNPDLRWECGCVGCEVLAVPNLDETEEEANQKEEKQK